MTDVMGFKVRGHALEEGFFIQKEHQEIAKIKALKSIDEKAQELTSLTGIKNKEIHLKALDVGLNEKTILAFCFFPLVYVAWADANVDRKEKNQIEAGLQNHSFFENNQDAKNLFGHWLEEAPGENIFQLWIDFIKEYKKNLNPIEASALSEGILELVEKVAKASGGVLGLNTISPSERESVLKIKEVISN